MDKFADILKDLIDEKSLSLRQLAKVSMVSANQYSLYLRGSLPTIHVAIRIANYFDCSLDYLFGFSLNKGSAPNVEFDIKEFLKRYNKTLKENKITHYKLCNEINLTESTIRNWKRGNIPAMDSILEISKGLSTSIDYLIGVKN